VGLCWMLTLDKLFVTFQHLRFFSLLMFHDTCITDSVDVLVFTLFLGPGVNAVCGVRYEQSVSISIESALMLFWKI
jgi:hypothetical protein